MYQLTIVVFNVPGKKIPQRYVQTYDSTAGFNAALSEWGYFYNGRDDVRFVIDYEDL